MTTRSAYDGRTLTVYCPKYALESGQPMRISLLFTSALPKLDAIDRTAPSRYSSGTLYYVDPVRPAGSVSSLAHATQDPLSTPARHPQHYISTTNLNINDHASTLRPSLPINRFGEGETNASRHSTVESDSGIVIVHPNTSAMEQQPKIEKKLTEVIEQMRRQLETDAQKLNEKLESKLQNLEKMINQQTYIIQRQDEVIERLKTKMVQIENERDLFRERLIAQEHEKQISRPSSTIGNFIIGVSNESCRTLNAGFFLLL